MKKTFIYPCVFGWLDLTPDPGQPMEVIGWPPDGAATIGIVKYGDGYVYLVSPHPDLTIEDYYKHMVNAMYNVK